MRLSVNSDVWRIAPITRARQFLLLGSLALLLTGCDQPAGSAGGGGGSEEVSEKETVTSTAPPSVGGGDIANPAIGPAPAFTYPEENTEGYILVKNWDFGETGTIRNMAEMSEHFIYHDQFGTIGNGTNYGAVMVAPTKETAIGKQPIEGVNTDRPVREFTRDSLKTYLVPLDGATEVHPTTRKAGSGSFVAKWELPKGGALLGMDMLWETRVRYETPPYYWFAIWNAGNKWNKGAEIDLVESFGYDNGGGITNYVGRYWHSSVVGGEEETNYLKNWDAGMRKYGITEFDATQYHTWTLVYRADDTFTCYMDGNIVQRGKTPWTLKAQEGGEPLDMTLLFDGTWGHRKVQSVNHPLPATALEGKFYEWDYSRVYLRPAPAGP